MVIELVTKKRIYINPDGENRVVLTTIDPSTGKRYEISKFSQYWKKSTLNNDYNPTKSSNLVFELHNNNLSLSKNTIDEKVEDNQSELKPKRKTFDIEYGKGKERSSKEITAFYR